MTRILVASFLASIVPVAVAVVTITSGTEQTIVRNTAVSGTVSLASNFPCWFSGTGPSPGGIDVADICGAAGTATAFGASPEGDCAAAGTAWSLTWNVVGSTHISIIECSGPGSGVGSAVALTLTEAPIVVTGGLTQTIAENAAIAGTVSLASNYPCWFTGTAPIATEIVCGEVTPATWGAGTATAFGASPSAVCAAAGTAWSLTWNVAASTHISIIECSGPGSGVGSAVALTITLLEEPIVVTGGLTQTIAKDVAIAGTVSVASNYPCWFTGSSPISTPIVAANCGAAGTATAFGSSASAVCAAAGTAWSLAWDVVGSTHVSLIECSGSGTGVSTAVALALTEGTATVVSISTTQMVTKYPVTLEFNVDHFSTTASGIRWVKLVAPSGDCTSVAACGGPVQLTAKTYPMAFGEGIFTCATAAVGYKACQSATGGSQAVWTSLSARGSDTIDAIEVTCAVLKANSPGLVLSMTDNNALGSVATYTCSPTYSLSNPDLATRTCTLEGFGGLWSPSQAPQCQLLPTCNEVLNEFLPGGAIPTFSLGSYLGSVATYTCNAAMGYTSGGQPMTRTCVQQEGYVWSGTVPACILATCTTPQWTFNLQPIAYSHGGNGISNTHALGTTATFLCNSGTALSTANASLPPTMTCTLSTSGANDVSGWSYYAGGPMVAAPQCFPLRCPAVTADVQANEKASGNQGDVMGNSVWVNSCNTGWALITSPPGLMAQSRCTNTAVRYVGIAFKKAQVGSSSVTALNSATNTMFNAMQAAYDSSRTVEMRIISGTPHTNGDKEAQNLQSYNPCDSWPFVAESVCNPWIAMKGSDYQNVAGFEEVTFRDWDPMVSDSPSFFMGNSNQELHNATVEVRVGEMDWEVATPNPVLAAKGTSYASFLTAKCLKILCPPLVGSGTTGDPPHGSIEFVPGALDPSIMLLGYEAVYTCHEGWHLSTTAAGAYSRICSTSGTELGFWSGVTPTCGARPPRIERAKFTNTGGSIIVDFDNATDAACGVRPSPCGSTSTFSCALIFNLTDNLLGDAQITGGGNVAECSWTDATRLRVDLTASSTIYTANSLPPLIVGSIRSLPRAGFAVVDAQNGGCNNGVIAVEAPDVLPRSAAAVKAVSVVGCGDDLLLDASGSTGSAGRDWKATWSLASTSDVNATRLSALNTRLAGADDQVVLTIPGVELGAGHSFVFKVILKNYFEDQTVQSTLSADTGGAILGGRRRLAAGGANCAIMSGTSSIGPDGGGSGLTFNPDLGGKPKPSGRRRLGGTSVDISSGASANGQYSEANITVTKRSTPVPVAAIDGASQRQVRPNQELKLQAAAKQPSACDGGNALSSNAIVYMWTSMSTDDSTFLPTSHSTSKNTRDLIFPPNTLKAGSTYEFQLEVNTVGVIESAFATVKVIVGRLDIVAALSTSSEGSSVGIDQDVMLDATPSYDPEAVYATSSAVGPPPPLTYSWCINGANCAIGGPIWTQAASTLGVGEHKITLTVSETAMCSSPPTVICTRSSASKVHGIKVLAGAPPPRVILSIPNTRLSSSGAAVHNIGEKLVLVGSVMNTGGNETLTKAEVDAAGIAWQWELPPTLQASALATPSLRIFNLVVKSSALTPDAVYTFKLAATSTLSGTSNAGTAFVSVKVNAAPNGGRLTAPPTAFAMTDTVALITSDWSDNPDDLPLTYEFFVATNAVTVAALAANGTSALAKLDAVGDAFARATSLGAVSPASRLEVQLPPPDSGGKAVALFVTATDIWGATSSMPAVAIVTMSIDTNLATLQSKGAELTAIALAAKAPDAVLRAIGNVARILNFDVSGSEDAHKDGNAVLLQQRVALRKKQFTFLSNATHLIADNAPATLELVASTLAVVSEGAFLDELSPGASQSIVDVAQDIATRSFEQATPLRPAFSLQIGNAISAVLRSSLGDGVGSTIGDVSAFVLPVLETLSARIIRDSQSGEQPISVHSSLIDLAVQRGTKDQVKVTLATPEQACAYDTPSLSSSFDLLQTADDTISEYIVRAVQYGLSPFLNQSERRQWKCGDGGSARRRLAAASPTALPSASRSSISTFDVTLSGSSASSSNNATVDSGVWSTGESSFTTHRSTPVVEYTVVIPGSHLFETSISRAPRCEYWNEQTKSWSSKGLVVASVRENGVATGSNTAVTCSSTHLSAFSEVVVESLPEMNLVHPIDDAHLIFTASFANVAIVILIIGGFLVCCCQTFFFHLVHRLKVLKHFEAVVERRHAAGRIHGADAGDTDGAINPRNPEKKNVGKCLSTLIKYCAPSPENESIVLSANFSEGMRVGAQDRDTNFERNRISSTADSFQRLLELISFNHLCCYKCYGPLYDYLHGGRRIVVLTSTIFGTLVVGAIFFGNDPERVDTGILAAIVESLMLAPVSLIIHSFFRKIHSFETHYQFWRSTASKRLIKVWNAVKRCTSPFDPEVPTTIPELHASLRELGIDVKDWEFKNPNPNGPLKYDAQKIEWMKKKFREKMDSIDAPSLQLSPKEHKRLRKVRQSYFRCCPARWCQCHHRLLSVIPVPDGNVIAITEAVIQVPTAAPEAAAAATARSPDGYDAIRKELLAKYNLILPSEYSIVPNEVQPGDFNLYEEAPEEMEEPRLVPKAEIVSNWAFDGIIGTGEAAKSWNEFTEHRKDTEGRIKGKKKQSLVVPPTAIIDGSDESVKKYHGSRAHDVSLANAHYRRVQENELIRAFVLDRHSSDTILTSGGKITSIRLKKVAANNKKVAADNCDRSTDDALAQEDKSPCCGAKWRAKKWKSLAVFVVKKSSSALCRTLQFVLCEEHKIKVEAMHEKDIKQQNFTLILPENISGDSTSQSSKMMIWQCATVRQLKALIWAKTVAAFPGIRHCEIRAEVMSQEAVDAKSKPGKFNDRGYVVRDLNDFAETSLVNDVNEKLVSEWTIQLHWNVQHVRLTHLRGKHVHVFNHLASAEVDMYRELPSIQTWTSKELINFMVFGRPTHSGWLRALWCPGNNDHQITKFENLSDLLDYRLHQGKPDLDEENQYSPELRPESKSTLYDHVPGTWLSSRTEGTPGDSAYETRIISWQYSSTTRSYVPVLTHHGSFCDSSPGRRRYRISGHHVRRYRISGAEYHSSSSSSGSSVDVAKEPDEEEKVMKKVASPVLEPPADDHHSSSSSSSSSSSVDAEKEIDDAVVAAAEPVDAAPQPEEEKSAAAAAETVLTKKVGDWTYEANFNWKRSLRFRSTPGRGDETGESIKCKKGEPINVVELKTVEQTDWVKVRDRGWLPVAIAKGTKIITLLKEVSPYAATASSAPKKGRTSSGGKKKKKGRASSGGKKKKNPADGEAEASGDSDEEAEASDGLSSATRRKISIMEAPKRTDNLLKDQKLFSKVLLHERREMFLKHRLVPLTVLDNLFDRAFASYKKIKKIKEDDAAPAEALGTFPAPAVKLQEDQEDQRRRRSTSRSIRNDLILQVTYPIDSECKLRTHVVFEWATGGDVLSADKRAARSVDDDAGDEGRHFNLTFYRKRPSSAMDAPPASKEKFSYIRIPPTVRSLKVPLAKFLSEGRFWAQLECGDGGKKTCASVSIAWCSDAPGDIVKWSPDEAKPEGLEELNPKGWKELASCSTKIVFGGLAGLIMGCFGGLATAKGAAPDRLAFSIIVGAAVGGLIAAIMVSTHQRLCHVKMWRKPCEQFCEHFCKTAGSEVKSKTGTTTSATTRRSSNPLSPHLSLRLIPPGSIRLKEDLKEEEIEMTILEVEDEGKEDEGNEEIEEELDMSKKEIHPGTNGKHFQRVSSKYEERNAKSCAHLSSEIIAHEMRWDLMKKKGLITTEAAKKNKHVLEQKSKFSAHGVARCANNITLNRYFWILTRTLMVSSAVAYSAVACIIVLSTVLRWIQSGVDGVLELIFIAALILLLILLVGLALWTSQLSNHHLTGCWRRYKAAKNKEGHTTSCCFRCGLCWHGLMHAVVDQAIAKLERGRGTVHGLFKLSVNAIVAFALIIITLVLILWIKLPLDTGFGPTMQPLFLSAGAAAYNGIMIPSFQRQLQTSWSCCAWGDPEEGECPATLPSSESNPPQSPASGVFEICPDLGVPPGDPFEGWRLCSDVARCVMRDHVGWAYALLVLFVFSLIFACVAALPVMFRICLRSWWKRCRGACRKTTADADSADADNADEEQKSCLQSLSLDQMSLDMERDREKVVERRSKKQVEERGTSDSKVLPDGEILSKKLTLAPRLLRAMRGWRNQAIAADFKDRRRAYLIWSRHLGVAGRTFFSRGVHLFAWVYVLCCVYVSCLYALKFSPSTAWKWLGASIVAFILDLIVLEPLMPIVASFFRSAESQDDPPFLENLFAKGSDNLLEIVGLDA